MGDIIRATLILSNSNSNPWLTFHHFFRDMVNDHGIETDWPVWAYQVTHWVAQCPIHHIDGRDFDNTAL
ncbi:Uncharacterised protein [Yersinia enterocolitica]|nr:Uncharacterised protein [Yersinia enterocolitica]